MYYEFYIDRFFAEQLLTELLLLRICAVFCREKIVLWRLLAGSLAGAAASAAAVCWRQPALYLCGLAAASAAVFWKRRNPEQLRRYLFCTAGLFLSTVCFGGACTALLAMVRLPVSAAALLGAELLRLGIACMERQIRRQRHMVPVTLTLAGKSVTLRGLVDTGNQLTEPFTGRPVSIAQKDSVKALLEEDFEKRSGFFLIPYHSLGTEKSWMMGIVLDEMRISGQRDSQVWNRPLLALYEGSVSAAGRYQVILHPEHADVLLETSSPRGPDKARSRRT